jgi:hypothetical protein
LAGRAGALAGRIFEIVAPRSAPRDLRASDADRDLVLALLSDAMVDGRLTAQEHADRAGQAHAALTLGQLAVLTVDLVPQAAQPFRLDGRRPVTGIFGRESRDGRWVVPDRLAVSAVFGEVTLDLREAMLQSSRVLVLATLIGGTLRVIAPEELAIDVTGAVLIGRPGAVVRGGGVSRDGGAGRDAGTGRIGGARRGSAERDLAGRGGRAGGSRAGSGAGGSAPGTPVIDIHAFALGGRVKVIRPRPPRRLNPLRRRF